MTMMQSNVALIQSIPENRQKDIYNYLIMNFAKDSPFAPLSEQEILDELAESRREAEKGNFRDFDDFMDELEAKYDL